MQNNEKLEFLLKTCFFFTRTNGKMKSERAFVTYGFVWIRCHRRKGGYMTLDTFGPRFDMGQVIFFGLLYIALMFWIAGEFQHVCEEKGYSSRKYFWICFLVPPAGWILCAALPDRAGRNGTTQKTEK